MPKVACQVAVHANNIGTGKCIHHMAAHGSQHTDHSSDHASSKTPCVMDKQQRAGTPISDLEHLLHPDP